MRVLTSRRKLPTAKMKLFLERLLNFKFAKGSHAIDQKFYGEHVLSPPIIFEWHKSFKVTAKRLKMRPVLGIEARAEFPQN